MSQKTDTAFIMLIILVGMSFMIPLYLVIEDSEKVNAEKLDQCMEQMTYKECLKELK